MKNIIIKSYCGITLRAYISFLQIIFNNLNISYTIAFLPTRERTITLLRSPHVFKKSKEQFKFSSFKVLITLKNTTASSTFLTLSHFLINKPKAIFIKIKT